MMESPVSEPSISVINADGSEGGTQLDPQEQLLLEGALKALHASPEFQAQYPNATLTHVESNRGVKDTAHGRLYLRFDVPGQAATEFWAHFGPHAAVAFKSGNITVVRP